MTPSPKEILTARKAYHRMRAFQRSKWNVGNFGIVIIFAGFMVWDEFQRRGLRAGMIAGGIWIVLLAAGNWQYQRQKKQIQKDSNFLDALKEKYGDGVYAEIQKEPSSIYYYIFQKVYPPAGWGHRDLI